MKIFQAKARNVESFRDAMFAGSKINFTEDRAVLHIALRTQSNKPVQVEGEDVVPQVKAVLQHMKQFTDDVRFLVFKLNNAFSPTKKNELK